MPPVSRGAKRKRTTTNKEATASKTQPQGGGAKRKGKAPKRQTIPRGVEAKRKGKTTEEVINLDCYGEIETSDDDIYQDEFCYFQPLNRIKENFRFFKRWENIEGEEAYGALISELKRLEEFKDIPQGETYQAALDLLLKGVNPSKNKRGKINSAMKDRVSELT